MTQSGPLKENSPPLSSTDDKKKITTSIPSTRKEQLDKENTSRSTGKQGKVQLKSVVCNLSLSEEQFKKLKIQSGVQVKL
jgi:hypothetical protein